MSIQREHAVGYRTPNQITVRSIITNTETNKTFHSDRIFNMTYDRFKECYACWNQGARIQDAFPELNVDEREHLMTGGPEVMNQMFGVDFFDEAPHNMAEA